MEPTETGGARELTEALRLHTEQLAALAAEQKRHVDRVAELNAALSDRLGNYLTAIVSKSSDMAASAALGVIAPFTADLKAMHADLVSIHTEIQASQRATKDLYDLVMKTRAQGNNTRTIVDDNTRRLDKGFPDDD